jgi:DNA polymerase-1
LPPAITEADPPPVRANLKTIRDVPHDYRRIASVQELEALLKILRSQKSFCFSVETNGSDSKQAGIIGISFSFAPGTGHYFQFPQEPEKALVALEALRPLFEDERIEKVGHDLKFDLSVLKWRGIPVRGRLFDTSLAHSLIEPEMRHTIEYLTEACLGYSPIPASSLSDGSNPDSAANDGAALDLLADHATEFADLAWQLRPILEPRSQPAVRIK